ncbi:YihY family protein [Roseibium sp. TrichSKD4]|uniref:YihY/virulence factor BrkB family protein n=1 Tax=Roseibium sp. TrichSKD4 TaxID=744980 RepID=UPI0001E56559|nr:YihY/virulence factor BrkB family protein [Roseibium sp. TrichSKD4]EFO33477.1 YihY family protein [Roseibium sp. TrichSKD4]
MIWTRTITTTYLVLKDALGHFVNDDGYAMASHVALSALLAVFPLLIFIAALAGFMGFHDAADRASNLVFDAWPENVAKPLVDEIHRVLTVPRGDLLTFGVVGALWFASNGVEAMRSALNRAYRQQEKRSIVFLRLQSLGLVILGAVVLIAYTFLVVLAPLVIKTVVNWIPAAEEFLVTIDVARYSVAGSLLTIGLLLTHWILPSGSRKFRELLPGVVATLVMWMVAGAVFGAYLAKFATYVTTYGGLAGIMSAVVFLYICSLGFILGGELNASMIRLRRIASSG